MASAENITVLPVQRQADPAVALYSQWTDVRAKAAAASGHECDELLRQADKIEEQLWATPALSLGGLLCKARVAEYWGRAGQGDVLDTPFEDLDWSEKVVTWLRLDIERLATLPT